MKRIGPKTEPWGTPQFRSEGEDFLNFIRSNYLCPFLHVGTEEGQGKITLPKVLSRRVKRMLSSIVSKAVLRSRRVRVEIEPESEAVRMSFKTRKSAVSVLCFGR